MIMSIEENADTKKRRKPGRQSQSHAISVKIPVDLWEELKIWTNNKNGFIVASIREKLEKRKKEWSDKLPPDLSNV